MSNYISQKELAKKLKKSTRTIGLWVEKGMAQPVNPDTYKSDGGYRFTEKEFERLQQIFDQLFLSDAAKIIGISPQYLGTLAKANPPEIPSQIIEYGKQKRRVFRRSDCLAFKEARENSQISRESGRELTLYQKNLRLFDSFVIHNQKVVAIDVNPIRLLSEKGYIIESIDSYLPASVPCLDLPYEKHVGSLTFSFPKTKDVYSKQYELISRMIQYLGTKNMRVFEKDDEYYVRTRIGRFKGSAEDLHFLNQHKLEGYLSIEGEFIELSSSVITKRTNYSKTVYDKILELSQKSNNNFDHIVDVLLKNALQAYEDKT
jgi:hypothetical protein